MEHRNFVIERKPQSSLCRIKWEGGGRLPKELEGAFTGIHRAKAAIDRYQNQLIRDQGAKSALRSARNKKTAENTEA
jgi:hypothetical protein